MKRDREREGEEKKKQIRDRDRDHLNLFKYFSELFKHIQTYIQS